MSPWLIVTAVAPSTVRTAAWMLAVASREAAPVAAIVGPVLIVALGAAWLRLRALRRSQRPSTS